MIHSKGYMPDNRRRERKGEADIDNSVMVECFLCKLAFKFGPNRYDGRAIGKWGGITICRVCVNHDGIVPGSCPHLVRHLQSLGIEVRLNDNGWIDIPN